MIQTEKRDTDYIFYELTRSVCPRCLDTIDAQILLKDGRVIMRKRCPTHGWFEALISSDAEMYLASLPYNKPGTMPLGYSTEVVDGCPRDCGLCPEHKQHTCLGLIEVNSYCNLDCPICFADGGYVNRCVNDIRRRPSQPLIQWRFHPHTVHRGRRLRSTQGPSDA